MRLTVARIREWQMRQGIRSIFLLVVLGMIAFSAVLGTGVVVAAGEAAAAQPKPTGEPQEVRPGVFRSDLAPATTVVGDGTSAGMAVAAEISPLRFFGSCSIWSPQPSTSDCFQPGFHYYYLGSGQAPEGHGNGQFRYLVSFANLLEAVTPGSHILNASFNVDLVNHTTSVGIPISLYGVTRPWWEASWLEADTFGHAGSKQPWTNPGGDFDTTASATNSAVGATLGRVSWGPITKLVQEWVDGESGGEQTKPAVGRLNYGLILSDPNPAAGSNVLSMEAADPTGLEPILDLEWEKEHVAPSVTLLGSAIAAAKEAKTSGTYELHVEATDGSPSAPQSGVRSILISVDGTNVKQFGPPPCKKGSCALSGAWTYTPASFGGVGHTITVQTTDFAGNVTTSVIGPEEVPGVADGNVLACPASGEAGVGSPVVEPGPGGGSILRYTLGDGSSVWLPHPPAGFDVMTASNSELETYGIPARPAGGVAEEEWIEEFQGQTFENKGNLCGLAESGSDAVEAVPPGGGAKLNNRYSGYLAFDQENHKRFTGIKGQFQVPTAHPNPKCSISAASSWVGMGLAKQGFMQAGSIIGNAGNVHPFIQVWKPDGSHHNIRAPVKLESEEKLRIRLTYSLAQEKISVVFDNRNTGKIQPVMHHLSSVFYDGSSIQWFEERPIRFANENLKNFGSIPWSHARGLESAGGGTWKKLQLLPWTPYVLRVNNTILAEPTGIGADGEGFTDNFKACTG